MENIASADPTILSGPVHREIRESTDRVIFVVGPRGFQNGLLIHFLEQSTGLRCVALDTVHHLRLQVNGDALFSHQVLWDFLGKEPEKILAALESEGRGILDHHLVALVNVRSGSGIEEASVALGVRGFFYENDPLDLFLKGIRAVFAGELWLSRELMTRCIMDKGNGMSLRPRQNALTPRETEILEMVVVGSTNDQIAESLCISPHTVKTHIYNIFKKIKVPNRFQAALWAAKNL